MVICVLNHFKTDDCTEHYIKYVWLNLSTLHFDAVYIWSYGAETGSNFKVTPGVKTISPAGAKRCIDSSNSNPFSRLLQSRRDKRWLQFLCRQPLNHQGHSPTLCIAIIYSEKT
jgi:hypothetical protein